MTPEQTEIYRERLAIMVIDGGVPEEEAARMARKIALNEGDEQLGFEAFKAFARTL